VRQNLALGYSLNGQWYESRAVAAQDLPLNIVDLRMIEWAAFARPSAAWDQVAGVLGVKPAFDSGQPVSLALVAPAGAPEYAAATPAEPEVVAAAEPYAATVVASAPVAAFEIPASSAAPVEPASYVAESQPEPVAAPLIKSDPAPIKTKSVAAPKGKLAVAKTSPQTTTMSGGGKYVVQLGAFSKASSADAAWKTMSKRTAALSGYDHSASKVQVNKASVYRLAVSGFTSRDDAGRVCAQVRSSGGACFVRSVGGDTNIRFAKRGNGTRLALAKRAGGKKVAVRKTVTTKRTVKVASR
jgi:hypothetical protein